MSKSASARRARRARSGAAALEFALVGPFFFVTMLGAMEVARYFMTIEGLRSYKADAMRHGIVALGPSQSLCRGELADAMQRGGVVAGLVSANPGVCVTRTESTGDGTREVTIRVTTDVTFRFIFNVFGVATHRIEDDVTFTFRI